MLELRIRQLHVALAATALGWRVGIPRRAYLRAEGMKPQLMGTTVAALEEMGMVARTPRSTDGRQMHIELTAKGAAMRKRTCTDSLRLTTSPVITIWGAAF
jgi:hypothetical protein